MPLLFLTPSAAPKPKVKCLLRSGISGTFRDFGHLLSGAEHFNPFGAKHGAPDAEERHVGDMGNRLADGNGFIDINHWIPNDDMTFFGEHSVLNK